MKLAIVNNDLGSGGAEKLIYDMALELKKDKSLKFDVIILNSKNEIYKKELEKENINVIALDSKYGIYNPFHIFKLRKILKNYDIVHAHVFPSQYWVGFSKKILPKNIKFLTTEHNTTNNRRNKWIFYYVDRFVYRSFERIICISDLAKDNLREWIKDEKICKKVKTINNGIKLSKYSKEISNLRENLNLDEKDIVVTMIARFTDQKDHKTLIRAMENLPKNYKLLLLGEGEKEEEYKKLVNKLKIENRIKFLGFRKDIPDILKITDIGVLSSNFEGLSIAALEIMASGCPLIGSDVEGVRDLIKNIGILYEHKNIKDLSEKIFDLGENIDFREIIGKKCLKASQEYNVESTVEKYKDIYWELKGR